MTLDFYQLQPLLEVELEVSIVAKVFLFVMKIWCQFFTDCYFEILIISQLLLEW